jgi:hypothetical protein
MHHRYRPAYSGGKWDEFLKAWVVGRHLQVCCGGSKVGEVRVDIDPSVPGVTVVANQKELPFRDDSFDTVSCDPIYTLPLPERIHLQRELFRVAARRVIFKAPWIPRGRAWHLHEPLTLIAPDTCNNVAVLSVLNKGPEDRFLPFVDTFR